MVNFNETDIIEWKQSFYGWWDAYIRGEKIKVPSISAIVEQIPDPGWDNFVSEVGEEKANKILKLAGDRGTVMHMLLENYYTAKAIKGDDSKAIKYTLQKTAEQLKSKDIEEVSINTGKQLFYKLKDSEISQKIARVVGLEKMIASFKYFYRGKYDITFLTNDNKRCITDFKASSREVESGSVKEQKYKMQLVGYWQGYEEMTGKELDFANLWISIKNSEPQEISISKKDKELLLPQFNDLCRQWHEKNDQSIELLSKLEYKLLK